MARFQGRTGEKAFSLLCSRAQITCNPSQEDDHGWDFLVEFPQRRVSGVPADLQWHIPAALIQVKTKTGTGLSIRMKLSNALNLVRSPNPTFLVMASVDTGGALTGWHAVHLWDDFAARVLRLARAKSLEGVREDLFHKSAISCRFESSDAKSDDDLLPWIEATIHATGLDYGATKSALRESIGFDGVEIVGSLQFGPIASIEELIDHQLGLTPNIPVKRVILKQRRFGIDIALPLPGGAVSYASMRAKPVARCQVLVKGPDGFEFETAGDLVVAAPPGGGAAEAKMRIQTPVLDIVYSAASSATVNSNFATADRRPLAEIEQTVRLLSWSGQDGIDLRVLVGDERLLEADMKLPPSADRDGYAWLARMIEPLMAVSRQLRSIVPTVSIEDLLEAGDLEAFFRFIHGDEMQANAGLEVPGLPAFNHCLAFGCITVGGWCFAALVKRPLLHKDQVADKLTMLFGKASLIEGYVWPAAQTDGPRALQDDFERYGKKPKALVFGDVIPLLRRAS